MRVGLGVDAHRFGPGIPLMLGTVEIPHPVGLVGHSDGDVVAHAVCDAVLAACGGPDHCAAIHGGGLQLVGRFEVRIEAAIRVVNPTAPAGARRRDWFPAPVWQTQPLERSPPQHSRQE